MFGSGCLPIKLVRLVVVLVSRIDFFLLRMYGHETWLGGGKMNSGKKNPHGEMVAIEWLSGPHVNKICCILDSVYFGRYRVAP